MPAKPRLMESENVAFQWIKNWPETGLDEVLW